MTATKHPTPTREAILADLATITTMQPGTLAEEYRQRPDPKGKGTVRLGPYYKHQCWEDGRNLSRRVSAVEVPRLREDLANHQRFEQLTEQLAHLTVAQTRALRAAEAFSAGAHEATLAKKNSRSSASPKGIAKVKSSSPRRAGASRNKG